MLEKDALATVIEILKPEVFYKEANQHIFEAIRNLFNRSQPVDILTVTNELKSMALLDVCGGPYYIAQLSSKVVSAANIEYHTRILIQKFIQRELIRISGEITNEAYEDTTDVFDLLDKAESNLFNVSDTNLRRKYLDMQAILKEAIGEIEKAKEANENNEIPTLGVPAGFTGIDRITAGWQKSDLIILAARPSMGKTAFVLSMARNAAIDHGVPVAVFSLEMSALQLVLRLISMETELPSDRLRRGQLEDYEWEQLNSRIKKLEDAHIFIDDTPALSIFELRAKSRRLVAQHGIKLIIIDYLQLMTANVENKGMREQEISSISRALKGLAKELNIPVIALSQLSREVEKRPGSKKPILSDLRESGAIEQDADLVLFGPILGEVSAEFGRQLRQHTSAPFFLDPQGTLRKIKDGKVTHEMTEDFKELTRMSRVVKANELETHTVTGLDPRSNPRKAVEALHRFGAEISIVTLAEAGSVIFDGKSYYEIPPYITNAIDPTGAGDTYAAGFCYQYLQDATDLLAAGCFGSAVASVMVENSGPDFPLTLDEAITRQKKLLQGPLKVKL